MKNNTSNKALSLYLRAINSSLSFAEFWEMLAGLPRHIAYIPGICIGTFILINSVYAQQQVNPGSFAQLQNTNGICKEDNFYAGNNTGSDTGEVNLAQCGISNGHVTVRSQLLLRSDERAAATGTIFSRIRVPQAQRTASNTILTTIATEVDYSGILAFNGVGSLEPAFASITLTLLVRDTTDNTIVASNTFLDERLDSDFILPSLDADVVGDRIFIKNSTGADLTAKLKRGREYQVEVEAVCAAEVPNAAITALVACEFHDTDQTDGIMVKYITVNAADDVIEKVVENIPDVSSIVNDAKTSIIDNDNANKTAIINNDNSNAATLNTNVNNTRTAIIANDNTNAANIVNNDNANRTAIINNANANTATLNTAITNAKNEILSNANANARAHLRSLIEADLATESNSVKVAWYMMPASRGGHLEFVREIVTETLANFAATGSNVNTAQSFLNRANADMSAGNFKSAYDNYRKAYKEAAK